MANPTLIAFSANNSGSATAASEASATLTWQTGDVLVAIGINNGGANGVTFSVTNTGVGLTWSQAQGHPSNSDSSLYLWTATATSNGSGTVTVSESTPSQMAMGVYQFRAPVGYSIAVGNSNIATGLTTAVHRVSLTMSSPDSAVVWAIGDWAAGAVETLSPTATSHSTIAPGPSASPASAVDAGQYTWYINDLDDETLTGSVTFGTTGSTGGPFAIAAVEVKLISAITPSVPPARFPMGV